MDKKRLTVEEINEMCRGIVPASLAIMKRNQLMIDHGYGTTFAPLKFD